MGVDAALYTLSTRAAEGRVGHPAERALQFYDESKCLNFIIVFICKSQNKEIQNCEMWVTGCIYT